MIAKIAFHFFFGKAIGLHIEEVTKERNEKQETAHC